MGHLDYVVIFLYLSAILAGGVAFARSSNDMTSFFGAGGQVPWWISGTSLFMSFFSAGTFVVWGTIAYELGWVAITMQWTMCVGGLAVGLLIAPRWRRTRALTAAEFIQKRFGTGLQQFYSYLILLYGVFATGAVLYPVAKMIAVATPYSLTACILVIGGIVVLYTTAGGLWSVLITDTLQFVILTAAVIVLVPLALSEIGGLGALARKAPDDFFAVVNGEYTPAFILAFSVYHVFLIGGRWGFVQRYTSVPSEVDARKVGLLFAGCYLVAPIIWMIPPMAYRVMNPGLTGLDTEGAYILVSEAVLPGGIIGLMFAAMISATASSANTTLNITAAVVTNDIYTDLVHPEASNRAQMIVARTSNVVIGGLMIGVALLVPAVGGIVNLVISMAALVIGPIAAPQIWGLFSRRLTAVGALVSTVVGLAVNFGFKFVTPALFDVSLSRGPEMAVGVGVPLVCLVGFELLRAAQERTAPAFEQAFGGTSFEGKSGGLESLAQNRFGLWMLAVMLSVTGVGLFVLSAFMASQVWVALSIGTGILVVSAGVWGLWKKMEKIEEDDSPGTPVPAGGESQE
ncbi:MAG: sodium:solute symporter family protein [Salinibacter sp.]